MVCNMILYEHPALPEQVRVVCPQTGWEWRWKPGWVWTAPPAPTTGHHHRPATRSDSPAAGLHLHATQYWGLEGTVTVQSHIQVIGNVNKNAIWSVLLQASCISSCVVYTVKPIWRDHSHEGPPVFKDHRFLPESHTFYGQWGDLLRRVLLYILYIMA